MDGVLGIDIAKAKFVAVLRTPDRKARRKSCPNSPAGFAELAAWLTRQQVARVHATLEATGTSETPRRTPGRKMSLVQFA